MSYYVRWSEAPDALARECFWRITKGRWSRLVHMTARSCLVNALVLGGVDFQNPHIQFMLRTIDGMMSTAPGAAGEQSLLNLIVSLKVCKPDPCLVMGDTIRCAMGVPMWGDLCYDEQLCATTQQNLEDSIGGCDRCKNIISKDAIELILEANETHDYGTMPVLADMLEDNVCVNTTSLRHLREHPVHGSGCWVIRRIMSSLGRYYCPMDNLIQHPSLTATSASPW